MIEAILMKLQIFWIINCILTRKIIEQSEISYKLEAFEEWRIPGIPGELFNISRYFFIKLSSFKNSEVAKTQTLRLQQ